MVYTVFLKRSAEKELTALPEKLHERIVQQLFSLKECPRPDKVKNFMEKKATEFVWVIIEYYILSMTQYIGLRSIQSHTGKMFINKNKHPFPAKHSDS
jgi:hypothetical protein